MLSCLAHRQMLQRCKVCTMSVCQSSCNIMASSPLPLNKWLPTVLLSEVGCVAGELAMVWCICSLPPILKSKGRRAWPSSVGFHHSGWGNWTMLAGLMEGRNGYSHWSTYRAKGGMSESLWQAACRCDCHTCNGQKGLHEVLAASYMQHRP